MHRRPSGHPSDVGAQLTNSSTLISIRIIRTNKKSHPSSEIDLLPTAPDDAGSRGPFPIVPPSRSRNVGQVGPCYSPCVGLPHPVPPEFSQSPKFPHDHPPFSPEGESRPPLPAEAGTSVGFGRTRQRLQFLFFPDEHSFRSNLERHQRKLDPFRCPSSCRSPLGRKHPNATQYGAAL